MEDRTLTQSAVDDRRLLVATGTALDNSNAWEMLEIIADAQERGFKYVIIDMGALEFLSSAGVGSILATVESFREAGGDTILCNLKVTVFHVLKVLDLSDYFTIAPNLEEALALSTAGVSG